MLSKETFDIKFRGKTFNVYLDSKSRYNFVNNKDINRVIKLLRYDENYNYRPLSYIKLKIEHYKFKILNRQIRAYFNREKIRIGGTRKVYIRNEKELFTDVHMMDIEPEININFNIDVNLWHL